MPANAMAHFPDGAQLTLLYARRGGVNGGLRIPLEAVHLAHEVPFPGQVTGCTDNREYLTRAMSSSFGSAFTAAGVSRFIIHSVPPPTTARSGLGYRARARSSHTTCGGET